MDEARLSEIRERLKKARRLPGYRGKAYVGGDHFCADDDGDEVYWYTLNIGDHEWSFNDSEAPDFFASAWNDLPDLLAAIDALRAEKERLRILLHDAHMGDAARWSMAPPPIKDCRACAALEAARE